MTQEEENTIVQSQFFYGIRYAQDKIAESIRFEQKMLASELERLNNEYSKNTYNMNISYERELHERSVVTINDRILDTIISSAQKIKELQDNVRELNRIRLSILDDVDFKSNSEEKLLKKQILAWEKQ